MSKKIIAVVLALTMAFSLCAVTASAENSITSVTLTVPELHAGQYGKAVKNSVQVSTANVELATDANDFGVFTTGWSKVNDSRLTKDTTYYVSIFLKAAEGYTFPKDGSNNYTGTISAGDATLINKKVGFLSDNTFHNAGDANILRLDFQLAAGEAISYTEIDSVKVTIPALTAGKTPAGIAADISSSTENVSFSNIEIYEGMATEPLGNTTALTANTTYYVFVCFEADEGYGFKSSGSPNYNYTGTITDADGNTLSPAPEDKSVDTNASNTTEQNINDILTLMFICTATEAGPEKIESVTLKGVPASLKAGQSAATVLADIGVSTDHVTLDTEGTFILGNDMKPFTGTFEPGKYYLQILLVADDGYCFPYNGTGEAATYDGTVNGATPMTNMGKMQDNEPIPLEDTEDSNVLVVYYTYEVSESDPTPEHNHSLFSLFFSAARLKAFFDGFKIFSIVALVYNILDIFFDIKH